MRFFRLVFNADSVHTDPGKIKATGEIEAPKNAKQLQELLGMATYMGSFMFHLSQHTTHPRELMKKDTDFIWSPSHQSVFIKIKELICSEIMLIYFKQRLKSIVMFDVSTKGIGAVHKQ